MRWLLTLVAVICLGGAWLVASPLWLGIGLTVGVLAAIAATLGFAQARIEGSSRPEFMSDPEIEALKSAVRRKQGTDSSEARKDV